MNVVDETGVIFFSSVTLKCILLVICVLCILCFYYLHSIVNRSKLGHIYIVHSKRIDCSTQTVYSITDTQCAEMCQQGDGYIEHNGICINKLILEYTNPISSKCDLKDGFASYLSSDGQLGTTYLNCLSIDPGIRSDDNTKKNKILKFGTIDIDYRKSYPQFETGRCDYYDDEVLEIHGTMNVRARGVCINRHLIRFFKI